MSYHSRDGDESLPRRVRQRRDGGGGFNRRLREDDEVLYVGGPRRRLVDYFDVDDYRDLRRGVRLREDDREVDRRRRRINDDVPDVPVPPVDDVDMAIAINMDHELDNNTVLDYMDAERPGGPRRGVVARASPVVTTRGVYRNQGDYVQGRLAAAPSVVAAPVGRRGLIRAPNVSPVDHLIRVREDDVRMHRLRLRQRFEDVGRDDRFRSSVMRDVYSGVPVTGLMMANSSLAAAAGASFNSLVRSGHPVGMGDDYVFRSSNVDRPSNSRRAIVDGGVSVASTVSLGDDLYRKAVSVSDAVGASVAKKTFDDDTELS